MIAVDWGTSSFRAYRLDTDGAILERREAPLGILAIANGRFAEALMSQVGDWAHNGCPAIIMSGMIGSRQGWREAPYAMTPAGADEIAASLVDVPLPNDGRAWIVPGVMTRSAAGVHDVMRGEETQILGALPALGSGCHRLCLPGTHSKWVTVAEGRIAAFTTHMTGEVFAVLAKHSILGRTMPEDAPEAWEAFVDGLDRAGAGGGLLHHLFGVRAQILAGGMQDVHSRDYLSGLLIGHECRAAAPSGTVHLLGAPALTKRYTVALERLGCSVRSLDTDAVTQGLWRIAAARGLIPLTS